MMRAFQDRSHAGQILASKLRAYADAPDVLVLGLARGGLPVAAEVAAALNAPLDVFIVRKLGVPGNPELAMGAIASGGKRVLNEDLVWRLGVPREEIDAITREEERELRHREEAYRDGRPMPDLRGKRVIIVDDGIATGASMIAAVRAIMGLHAERVVVAVPVAAPATCRKLEQLADEVVVCLTPPDFYAVGLWYEDFPQITDEDVRRILSNASTGELQSHDGIKHND